MLLVRTLDGGYTPYKLLSGAHINRTYSTDAKDNITAFDGRTSTYDVMDRLKTHTGPDGSWQYGYDLNGNRNWHKRNAVQRNYNYNTAKTRLNSLTGGTSETRAYDAEGNAVRIGSRTLDYNDLNRFWRYTEGSTTVTYAHNAFGERQLKNSGTTTTRFLSDGPNLLHERVGTTKRDYIYLAGEVVGMVKNGVLYFVHNDHLGRAEVITNATKAVVWSSENNAFGNNPGASSVGDFNLGFPGQYYDIESGTYYNYFRTYDATTGRYLQSDPTGLAGGLNTYAYAASNPVRFTDSLGLDLDDNRNRNVGILSGCVTGAIVFGKGGAAACTATGPAWGLCEGGAILCGCLGGAIGGGLIGLGADTAETVFNESSEDSDPAGADDGKQGPTSSDDVTQGIGKIASGTGLSERDVRDRIHGAKGNLPKGTGIRNPDIGVDLVLCPGNK